MKSIMTMLVACAIAPAAMAQVWAEVGDAPARTAAPGLPSISQQVTVGVGPLLAITGHGEYTPGTGIYDADVYCVYIDGPWSASTLGSVPAWDTMLLLTSADGATTHAFNDDAPFPQSFISGTLPAGVYQLAISRYADFGFTGPGVGATPYTITLTGMSYCIPTPGSVGLLALGGLAAIRRRR